MSEHDYLIIGAGIVGLATAWHLRERFPDARIAVLEKELAVARHQSGHNSGVIHAGVYYPPDSLKARFCRRGVDATLAFCAAHDVPARRCGKLIVATTPVEVERLDELGTRAERNGLTCSRLDRAAIAAREPSIAGLSALYVAETGIADYAALCRKLAALFVAAGGELLCGEAVRAIHEDPQSVHIDCTSRSFTARRLIVCGGLQADRLARLAGLDCEAVVVPFRGDYYRLPPARSDLVRTLIYPVPDPGLPFLGVHLTLTTDGGLTVGPTAMLALARERYRKWAVERDDCLATLKHPGTWRLLSRFPRAGALELAHACSRRLYLRAARRYCPTLELSDLAEHECGIRAQLVARDGRMIHDFLLERTARSVHVLNAPSPAATSAFPIAEAIVDKLHA